MSRRKQRSPFDQVFEFDRGRIVATEIVDYLSGKSVVVLDENKQLLGHQSLPPINLGRVDEQMVSPEGAVEITIEYWVADMRSLRSTALAPPLHHAVDRAFDLIPPPNLGREHYGE
ncbi:hypothetical protein TNCV_2138061 [Trichonephila clavipes]|nr:hypothetical protein TNCV_2138061 [Trichonephila clavipes]